MTQQQRGVVKWVAALASTVVGALIVATILGTWTSLSALEANSAAILARLNGNKEAVTRTEGRVGQLERDHRQDMVDLRASLNLAEDALRKEVSNAQDRFAQLVERVMRPRGRGG